MLYPITLITRPNRCSSDLQTLLFALHLLAYFIGLALPMLLPYYATAQEAISPESTLRLRYKKSEHSIPMRDGSKLHTTVFSPSDTTRTYPILMKRTPYSCAPYGADAYPSSLGPSEHFSKAGYIFIHQDVRGRFMSEGTFQQVTPHIVNKKSPTEFDESSDTYDTIDWLIKNIANHNGRVGMFGISQPKGPALTMIKNQNRFLQLHPWYQCYPWLIIQR